MEHPQTLAIELNKHFTNPKLKAIGDLGCCAFVLLWCLWIEPEDIEAIQILSTLMNEGVLDKECTVFWADAVRKLTGRELKKFEKIQINSLKGIKQRTPVKFTYNGAGHWVGVENERVAFNPLKTSVCVNQGCPTEARELSI